MVVAVRVARTLVMPMAVQMFVLVIVLMGMVVLVREVMRVPVVVRMFTLLSRRMHVRVRMPERPM